MLQQPFDRLSDVVERFLKQFTLRRSIRGFFLVSFRFHISVVQRLSHRPSPTYIVNVDDDLLSHPSSYVDQYAGVFHLWGMPSGYSQPLFCFVFRSVMHEAVRKSKFKKRNSKMDNENPQRSLCGIRCYNGSTCRPSSTGMGYSFECTAQFTGPPLPRISIGKALSKGCGGRIRGESVAFAFPWEKTTTVTTWTNSLSVVFEKFDLAVNNRRSVDTTGIVSHRLRQDSKTSTLEERKPTMVKEPPISIALYNHPSHYGECSSIIITLLVSFLSCATDKQPITTKTSVTCLDSNSSYPKFFYLDKSLELKGVVQARDLEWRRAYIPTLCNLSSEIN
ncbi:unnamed protein product [Cyprideis torosa]|uniref:Uncharacterized protein n=1 Tax=Cyprideis torosa TaxID=163714 RepID=A0A7R8WD68_9CRUS|nr:unnamed protein product [Cyprideis torosa]CAG0894328.1 unnamed protein product [Cyprideis torosa]